MTDYKLVPDEEVAKMFHESYEKLAPSFGYETREETRKNWERVPPNNKALMIAVIKQIRQALLTSSHSQQSDVQGEPAMTDDKPEVNYIVTTQGWSGKKVTGCETEEQAWEALGDCSFGALTNVYSPTGKDVSQFIPY